ncbi:hypothetical protein JCM19037_1921 [Geomicrobium sp. JCM 19037]|nr:hypothetical protein JCM19037_1921 [Geomicrobium sp. JCM 19037]
MLAYVIDANTNTLLGTINLDRNVNTRSVSINADARRAYLSDLESDSIYVIDTVTNNVIQELPFRAFALASYTP